MTDSAKPEIPESAGASYASYGGSKVPSLDADQRYSGGRVPNIADAELEAELAEAMGGMTADQLLADETKPQRKPAGGEKPSSRLKGRVLAIHGPDVFVEVPGGRSQGVLPMEQFEDTPPKVGDVIEFSIEGVQDGMPLLSLRGAAVHVDWSSVAEGMTVEAKVTAVNKGGLAVEVNGIRGFMPISQIDIYRIDDATPFVNQKLKCIIAEVDPLEKNLVVSRRALLEKERLEQRDKLWATLDVGQIHEGIVRSVREFGAFVDLGGADGLLHVSEMSWSRGAKAEDLVQPGQKVKVVVTKLDRETKKIGLGMKQLGASPWDAIHDRFAVGSIVNGKVTRLADFGAFVELEPAIEGLIHISELAPQRVHRVKDIVQVGQDVSVKVMSIDPAQRRIGLSLKAAMAKPDVENVEEEEEEDYIPEVRLPNPNLRGGLGDRR